MLISVNVWLFYALTSNWAVTPTLILLAVGRRNLKPLADFYAYCDDEYLHAYLPELHARYTNRRAMICRTIYVYLGWIGRGSLNRLYSESTLPLTATGETLSPPFLNRLNVRSIVPFWFELLDCPFY